MLFPVFPGIPVFCVPLSCFCSLPPSRSFALAVCPLRSFLVTLLRSCSMSAVVFPCFSYHPLPSPLFRLSPFRTDPVPPRHICPKNRPEICRKRCRKCIRKACRKCCQKSSPECFRKCTQKSAGILLRTLSKSRRKTPSGLRLQRGRPPLPRVARVLCLRSAGFPSSVFVFVCVFVLFLFLSCGGTGKHCLSKACALLPLCLCIAKAGEFFRNAGKAAPAMGKPHVSVA